VLNCLALLAPNASTAAAPIDTLFWGITAVAVFFAVAIFLIIIVLSVHYRRGNHVDRSRAPQYHLPIELAWTIIPLGIAMVLFAWSSTLFFTRSKVPKGAMEIYVVGKQWMWKMQHPQGRWENNELHVPVGVPIVLTMTSEDVIHSFYVPAFRLKQDVIPGQYTQMWFQATEPGTYHLFCAEFCGTLHSTMVGSVIVQEKAEYEKWLESGPQQPSLAAEGAKLFTARGCAGCHGANGVARAPRLEGIYGKSIPVQIPKSGQKVAEVPATTTIANAMYIHDSILEPEKMVAAGYKPIMPSYQNRISEEQILKLVAYIKSLSNSDASRSGFAGDREKATLSDEDYKARIGFVPENRKKMRGAETGTAGNGK
jgi:cytochrome c oxidase subunit II